ncbi:MAG TPA: putative quinol monooxygenase [Pirellulales bacterium]|jgi:quinol monooxygenase YgiN|nr:putative quinol monooxygenase [Pirellulales bacterium]
MLHLVILLTVKNDADVSTVAELLREQGRLSRQEPGCDRFDVYHSEADPKLFILCEHWTTQEALDAHRKAAAYTTIYQPKVLPLVDRVPHKSSLV